MPSWNIHIAHAERLLADDRWESWHIRDANAFVFGNLVPDIYVGYMVPDPSKKIAYKDTHLAEADFIPTPDASTFFERYLREGDFSEVTLGAWCHLLCDHYYNLRTIEYIARIGVEPGTSTRIRKQADFDVFGRTHEISWQCSPYPALIAQCAAFEQYPIEAADVEKTCEAVRQVIAKNSAEHVETPTYDLLSKRFFHDTFCEVQDVLTRGLTLVSRGEDARHLGRPL